MLSLAIRDRVVLVGERLDGQHRAEGLLLGDRHGAGAPVEDGGQVVEAAGQLRVVGPGPAAAQDGALGEAGGDVRLDLVRCAALVSGPVSAFSSNGPPRRICPARATRASTKSSWIESCDDQPGAGRADLAGVQEDRGERVVEGDLEVGVGEDDVGVLAARARGRPASRCRRPRP